MSQRGFLSWRRRGWLLTTLLLAGCGRLSDLSLPGMPSEADLEARFRQEEECRRRFATDRDPEAIRWLKANRLQSGLTLGDVNQILGEDGTLVVEDRKFKNGALYRRGDKVYKWGPDSDGVSHYLVFREGQLVNFDPKEYEPQADFD